MSLTPWLLIPILVQVNLFALAVMLLYVVMRIQGPAAGRWVASMGLAGILVVTLLAAGPWPRWSWARLDGNSPGVSLPNSASTTASAFPAPVIDGHSEEIIEDEGSRPDEGLNPARSPQLESPLWEAVVTGAKQFGRTAAVREDRATITWVKGLLAMVLMAWLIGFVRLAGGLWAVGRLVRRSQPVTDRSLVEQAESLLRALGSQRAVTLRETPKLASPATIGWRRPILLLPKETWRSWDDSQRRAVLAHECAHVARNDYLAWLLAQLTLVLHFYHPIVHWLTGRLRLDQELTADARAAQLLGNQEVYLTALARLALREGEFQANWPACTFLPTRPLFLRRIEMLRKTRCIPREVSWRLRIVSVIGLILAGGLVSGVREAASPSSSAEARAQESKTNSQPRPEEQGPAEDAPLSLAYVPTDALGVVALRPARLAQTASLRPLAEIVRNQRLAEELAGIELQRIRLLTVAILPDFDSQGRVRPAGEPYFVLHLQTADDVKRIIGHVFPEATETRFGPMTVYRQQRSGVATWTAAVGPDEPAVLILSTAEPVLRRAVVAGVQGARDASWLTAWSEIEGADVAAVVNVPSLRVTLDSWVSESGFSSHWTTLHPLWRKGESLAVSAQLDDPWQVTMRMFSGSGQEAKQIEETLTAARTLSRNMLSALRQQIARSDDAEVFSGLMSLELVERAVDRAQLTTLPHPPQRHPARQTMVTLLTLEGEDTSRLLTPLVPAIEAARSAAKRTLSSNNLKMLALAMHNYHDVHTHFPPPVVLGPDGRTPHSWRVALLPYLGAADLYEQYRQNEPWDSPHNLTVLERMPAYFRHPSADPSSTFSSYYVVTGPETVFHGTAGARILEIHDGTSYTLMMVEARRDIPWTKPEDIPYDRDNLPELGGYQPEGFQAAFCDGSVRFLAKSIDRETLWRLLEKADGFPVQLGP